MSHGAGDRIGKYEVLRFLGRGACGEVLLVRRADAAAGAAEDYRSPLLGSSVRRRADGSLFALKLIPCDTPSGLGADSADVRAREAALAEAKLLQELRHPHIVRCQEVYFDKQRQVARLVLEYMDGGDLQSFIAGRREGKAAFDGHFARRVLAALGGALVYIHAVGILHRDVKPANVLLSKRSLRIKLADFGISKLVEASTLKAKSLVGTPHYLSPEVVSSDWYGAASDAWALGCCIYEVAALRRPFDASNQLSLVRKICDEQPEALPSETPQDISKVVDGLLRKDADARLDIQSALTVSPAVAALVVDTGGRGGEIEEDVDVDEEEIVEDLVEEEVVGGDDADSHDEAGGLDDDSWCDAKPVDTWLPGELGKAAGAARAALGADVDDPEELCLALKHLEEERARNVAEGDGQDSQAPCIPEATADAAALDALGDELKLRIQAMKEEAAALLEGLIVADNREDADESCLEQTLPRDAAAYLASELQTTADTSSPSADAVSNGVARNAGESSASSSCVSTPRGRGAATVEEEALETATCLGVDTEPAEEHLVSVRKMLSVRVLWADLVRFCLVPLRVTYKSLARQVGSRFGLPPDSELLQLECWSGAGESLLLDSQAAWEECLQRRGLAEKPGRLELRVVSQAAPPKRRQQPVQAPPPKAGSQGHHAGGEAPSRNMSVAGSPCAQGHHGNAGFFITGMSALPLTGYDPASVAAPSSGGGGPPGVGHGAPDMKKMAPRKRVQLNRSRAGAARGRAGRGRGTATSSGVSWDKTSGRDRPVHWAPEQGGQMARDQDSPEPSTDFSLMGLGLEGRSMGVWPGGRR
eukprot:TRINITY_DN74891_c0_g1_i1.p1 TRINITY_DN74891_c0_g1~~TRINITY_DN74891_c0_g1_i1.p1  ORF type:complete len:820 (-),score=200.30 TRINITY_DN74891_c0_g1_i1:734-3193(-)